MGITMRVCKPRPRSRDREKKVKPEKRRGVTSAFGGGCGPIFYNPALQPSHLDPNRTPPREERFDSRMPARHQESRNRSWLLHFHSRRAVIFRSLDCIQSSNWRSCSSTGRSVLVGGCFHFRRHPSTTSSSGVTDYIPCLWLIGSCVNRM